MWSLPTLGGYVYAVSSNHIVFCCSADLLYPVFWFALVPVILVHKKLSTGQLQNRTYYQDSWTQTT